VLFPNNQSLTSFFVVRLFEMTVISGLLVFVPKLSGEELPLLPAGFTPQTLNYQKQKELPDLKQAYLSIAPKDLGDGLKVGVLDLPGTQKAVETLRAADQGGKFANLDSILLWKDGRLIFEMYNRRGRVDAPHYTMSVTKTLTSLTLARAMQLGFLGMKDLDKPVIDFMPAIDRSKIKPGVSTITLRDALMMKSGLRFKEKFIGRKLGEKYRGQAYFQKLFELTAPINPKSKQYKYTGTDPSLVMMVIELKTPGKVQDFIKKELVARVNGGTYLWGDQGCGIPKCGAGSNFTSRTLLKFSSSVIAGGKYNGQQLLHPDYVKLIMDTNKGDGYFYFFHNRRKKSDTINFISGIGAGGQYMAAFPKLNLVAVATSHNKGQIGKPLEAILNHLVPLFEKN